MFSEYLDELHSGIECDNDSNEADEITVSSDVKDRLSRGNVGSESAVLLSEPVLFSNSSTRRPLSAKSFSDTKRLHSSSFHDEVDRFAVSERRLDHLLSGRDSIEDAIGDELIEREESVVSRHTPRLSIAIGANKRSSLLNSVNSKSLYSTRSTVEEED